MRNVLEEQYLVTQRDVVEQDQMLVQLAHIANVRNDGKREFLGE
jgi:hypothetical protein